MNRSCILHVDDDPNDRFLLEHAAHEAGLGLQLLCLESGEELISYLSGKGEYANRSEFPLPCVILLDVKMKALTGFDVLAWIRRRPQFQDLVVIMVSGSRHDHDVERAARLGANSFVSKP